MALLTSLGAFGVILSVVIGILYALFPLIVMIQLHNVVKNGEKQNRLTRQLLRAYGHEPEA